MTREALSLLIVFYCFFLSLLGGRLSERGSTVFKNQRKSKNSGFPIKDSGNDGEGVDASLNFRHDKREALGVRGTHLESLGEGGGCLALNFRNNRGRTTKEEKAPRCEW